MRPLTERERFEREISDARARSAYWQGFRLALGLALAALAPVAAILIAAVEMVIPSLAHVVGPD